MKTSGTDSTGGRASPRAKAATRRATEESAAAGAAKKGGTKSSGRAAGASKNDRLNDESTRPTEPASKRSTGRTAKKGTVVFSASVPPKPERFKLKLYVAGQSPRSVAAFANLRRICEEHLEGQYEIEVIDLLVNPKLARGDQILAIPTLVRALPTPISKIIGDLSNTERVLVGLNIRPRR